MAAAITAAFGSFYCSCSAVAEITDWESVPTIIADADANVHGITDATAATTAAAANFMSNNFEGIFGCPHCHENSAPMLEALKLFLPYFPLHIQKLISMYLKILEMMHTMEMVQNMMNHMDEYQALFQMFEGFGNTKNDSTINPFTSVSSIFQNGAFTMQDINSVKNMMEGSDLVDEFTYMEGSSGTCGNGS